MSVYEGKTNRRIGRSYLVLAAVLALGFTSRALADSFGPTIDVWYGAQQRFGHVGIHQKWFNVLGKVSDPDGVDSLEYSLNGGPDVPLSIGPDTRRLANPGDFNIDIDRQYLVPGSNQVVITAYDTLGNPNSETVTVQYFTGNVWPEPYAVDWATVSDLSDVAQVVDGLWTSSPTGLRTVELGYDRIVAIGDIAWDDYEVTVPITMHATDPNGYQWPSIAPGLGIVMRWRGHSDWGGWQPVIGWLPMGAAGWYDFGNNNGTLHLEGDSGRLQTDTTGRHLTLGVTYIWKLRASTMPGAGTWYGMKVWRQGLAEPANWELTGMQGLDDLPSGSLLLVAHHVDATFGDVTIEPLDTSSSLLISNVVTNATQTSATISWATNEPATSEVAYGLTSAYELGSVVQPALVTNHSVMLTGLTPQAQYHFRITSEDDGGEQAETPDATFTTLGEPSTMASDDFSAPALNTSLWTYRDPVGGVSMAMTGSQLSLTIPPSVDYDAWTDGAMVPRVVQAVNDTDFEMEVKFESGVTERFQSQGILIEESPTRFLRFDFYFNGTSTRLFAASITDGVASVKANKTVSDGAPIYLRVDRTGSTWTADYSYDGQVWLSGTTFAHSMSVSTVGPFAGSSGTNPSNGPGFTCLVDYFFNTAAPIVPEDGGDRTVTVNVLGNGTVTRTPDQATYMDGDTLELEAIPAPGWSFVGWGDDLAGSPNPVQLVIAGDLLASAVFAADGDVTPPAISNIVASPSTTTAIITWTTNEPATSSVAYGPSTAYENGIIVDSALVVNHSITLTGLATGTVYHYRVTSSDAADNTTNSTDRTFTTTGGDLSGIVSDDFSAPVLNGSLWTLVDPVGDAILSVSNAHLHLTVPAGSDHDIWAEGAFAPRVMQPANNTDFEVQVKFASALDDRYQTQGLLVTNGSDRFLRFDFYSDGQNTRVFAAYIAAGSASSKFQKIITGGVPLYMRVSRSADQWIQSYSYNGTDWAAGANFAQAMTVAQVGVFVGNSGAIGTSAPEHTAVVDYVFNTASPIVPEDGGGRSLVVNTIGSGSVLLNPQQTTYADGQHVQLDAVPAPGWGFSAWSGGLTGSADPGTIIINGDMVVTATFAELTDDVPPVISQVAAAPSDTEAVITWTTDEPATSRVDFGRTAAYEIGSETDLGFVTSHSVTLTGLLPGTTYHFRVVSEDANGNEAASGDWTFGTAGEDPSGIVSDDFSTGALDTGLWTLIDPLGDASLTMTGTAVSIGVPAGVLHTIEPGGNSAPRIMQSANDTDCEIEVKFESPVTQPFQLQGVLFEEDADSFVHVEFYSDGSSTRVFGASVSDGVQTDFFTKAVGGSSPLYMRVHRAGDDWTMEYSFEGQEWAVGGSVTQSLVLSAVGVFLGNDAISTPPAHSAVVDYFFNTASPIVPEDGDSNMVSVTVLGNGTVAKDPDQPTYSSGTVVELTATPDPGWSFAEWSGDVVGTENPVLLTVTGNMSVQAAFSEDSDTTPPLITNLNALPDDTSVLVTWTTDEPATSSVAYGLTSAHEIGIEEDLTLVVSHSVTLTGLQPGTVYHYAASSEDLNGNEATSGDLAFATTGSDLSGIVSDDFSSGGLNTNLWTWVDPVGDATLGMTGTELSIALPPGVFHAIGPGAGGNTVPRIMQPANDTDFEIEVKFESPVTQPYQLQGVLFEEDADSFVHFEFYNDGPNTRIYGSSIVNTVQTRSLLKLVGTGAPLYMRVARSGATWTVEYSLNGQTWSQAGSLSQSLVISAVGVFGGNDALSTPPAHTAFVDYFFNTASPIVPEDGDCPTGQACDDGNPCTDLDACANGVCAGTPVNCSTLDGPCTDGACNPATGACEVVPANEGGTCDDVDLCTQNSACSGGACVGEPIDCDDGNPCTDDSCNPAAGCEYDFNTVACDDQDACTENDACADGVCAGDFVDCDGDGVCDVEDNCPGVSNVGQLNADADAFGDACDGTFDADHDGDVDAADYVNFVACMTGDERTATGPCLDSHDADADLDVDVLDWAELQVAFTGATGTTCP